MCEFVSWVEHEGAVLFLTTGHLRDKKGKETAERRGDDVNGHGAIREYYDLKPGVGVERECLDFSTPDNFPAQIVDAIKAGKMRGFGLGHGLLTPAAWAEYDKVRRSALAEYLKVHQSSWAEYDKVKQPAWAEYEKVQQPAWAEYEKVYQSAWAEYQKVQQHTFWDLFKKQENRAEAWR